MSASVKLRSVTGGVKVTGSVIRGVAILSTGPAKTHGFVVDATMLRQVEAEIRRLGKTKVRMSHPDGEDIALIVGHIENPRIVGNTLRGDLVLLRSSPHAEYVRELAETLPDQVGMSIEASVTYLTQGGERYARVEKLIAVDLVGLPAGVANGLLSQKVSLNMNEKELQELRSLLGLDESATAADIMEAVKNLLAEEPEDNNDTATMSAKSAASVALKAVERERTRASQIRGLARAMKLPDPDGWAERQIQNGATFEECGAIAVQLRQRLDAETTPRGSGIRMHDNANNTDVLQCATLMHLGRTKLAEKTYPKHTLHAAQRLDIRSARDLAKQTVRMSGRADPFGRTESEVVKLAFSTMSLPETLGSSLDKVAAEVYQSAPKTWLSWCGTKSAQSFRTHTAIRPFANNSALAPLPPGGIIKHGTLEEETYTYKISTAARMLSLSRQAVIDDSLNLLADLTEELARQAARSIADDLYETLLANADDFFGTGNGNLLTGTGSVLNFDGLNAAIATLRRRKDGSGRVIGLTPAVILVPPTLESTALQLVNSPALSRADDEDNAPTGNPNFQRLVVEVEPRLEDDDFSGASSTAWYLFTAPSNPAAIVAYLNAQESPTIETADTDFSTLGIQMRAYMDYGVALADYRAGVLNSGTT